MNGKVILKWSLAIIWFAGASFLVLSMNTQTTKAFDHDLRLSQQLMSLEFETNFSDLLNELTNEQSAQNPVKRLIHFESEQPCFCQTLAQAHINTLNSMLEDSDVHINTLNVSKIAILKHYVPSTPAVAVIDSNGELAYFGPYSSGSGCFGRSGEVNEVVKQRFLEPNALTLNSHEFSRAIIRAEARGCYCHQS
uniref:DUF6436 domain-containing protein n=1 Tax=Ningiella ruwaisensis TaxID=2364274 RepID=UPI00109F0649|nr:DUF6436 domain-containing protein [Ningiella ruwaisensis]